MIEYILIFTLVIGPTSMNKSCFPENFIFGVGTSSYQSEGAWNEGGKGLNIWDYYLHQNPDYINDRSNGDVACDFYHKWKEDVRLIKNLGVDFYRFSISWARILPMGFKDTEINEEGVRFYSDLIDALLAEEIKPHVTIYHWDLPHTLQEQGGWLNESLIDDYVFYARTLFQLFGDRVKGWTTFNEIMLVCEKAYSAGVTAPFWKSPGVGGYQSTHTVLLAHGHTYRMYEKEFKSIQKGKVGLSVNGIWCEPETDSDSDKDAAERYMQFNYGWFIHPLLIGNYPPIMIETIDAISKQQGFKESRLPKFTPEQIDLLRGSLDFLGLNHYSTELCTYVDDFDEPSFEADCGVNTTRLKTGIIMPDYQPEGFRKLLVWIKERYNNPPILITENGAKGYVIDITDNYRIEYHTGYLAAVLDAIFEDNCNVFGYAIWSLTDQFEWILGYEVNCGLVYVDFDSVNRTRMPRASYAVIKDIVKSRKIN